MRQTIRPKKLLAGILSVSCVALLVFAGCDDDEACSSGQCEGSNGSCLSCAEGSYCTTSPSGNCSDPVEGVYCCTGSGGGGNDDGSCNSGYCYTGVSCCPTTAPWQGGNNCYQTSDDCHSAGYSTCYGC
jgi:hypothetical protein